MRGLLEFVWFVDLHKVLVTDSCSVFISFSLGFINNAITSFQCDQNDQSFCVQWFVTKIW